MKRVVVLICSILLVATFVSGQNRRELMKQRIYEKKVEFIKSQVTFTPDEEKAFWPLYKEYMTKKAAIREKFKDVRIQMRRGADINYEQYNDMVTQMAVDEATLIAVYYQKLKKVLPAQKIYQLFQAEKNFKKQLLEKVSDPRSEL